MFVAAKKQAPSTLITLVIPQLIAGYLAFLFNKYFLFKIKM